MTEEESADTIRGDMDQFVQDRRSCWITWERHQRSRSLSAQLKIPLIELSRPGSRPARYLRNSWTTLGRLLVGRYHNVYVQAPSVVLAVLAVCLAPILRYRVVVDAHNAVIEGAESGSLILRMLYRFVIKRARLVIVTNSALASRVSRLGGVAGILPDPVPPFRRSRSLSAEDGAIVVISTWAGDEPLDAVFEAAERLPEPLTITVTGRPRGRFAEMAARSRRIKPSGFVSDEDYVRMLETARVVIDLTTREDCLVCGAYEALALGCPLVVSDSRALRELLQDGALYTPNEPVAIAAAIQQASENAAALAASCAARRDSYLEEWRMAAGRLLQEMR